MELLVKASGNQHDAPRASTHILPLLYPSSEAPPEIFRGQLMKVERQQINRRYFLWA